MRWWLWLMWCRISPWDIYIVRRWPDKFPPTVSGQLKKQAATKMALHLYGKEDLPFNSSHLFHGIKDDVIDLLQQK